MERKIKPWGYEEWVLGDRIVMKKLYVRSGESLSLQYHEQKEEILYIQSGAGIFHLDGKNIHYSAGNCFVVKPKVVHRLSPSIDTLVIEASTPELEDVVRLEDQYNRD